jgi:molybdopterin-containing oxidoreductase family iron-sulfur binding subunit
MTRYGMAIDLRRCIGCQACAAACKMANNLPKELTYNVVYTKGDDDFDSIGTAVSRLPTTTLAAPSPIAR